MSWRHRVVTLFRQQNRSYRDVASRANMSHTHVTNILEGRTTPSLEMLFLLLNALTTNEQTVQSILQQFARENPDFRRYTTQRERIEPPSKADILALTLAINTLVDELRQQREGQADHH